MAFTSKKSEVAANQPPTRRAKERSPSYPSITFDAALARVKKLYEVEKRHTVEQKQAMAWMGNQYFNGYARAVLASLKQFELIDSMNGSIRVSEDAEWIILYPPEDPKRAQLLRELPMRPTVFQKIVAQWGKNGLPGDQIISAWLQQKEHFTGEACKTLLKVLRESIKASGDGVDEAAVLADPGAVSQFQDAPLTAPSATSQAAVRPIYPQPPPRVLQGYQSRTWKLDNNKTMVVQLPPPSDLTKRDIEKARKYLDALEAEAKISWDDATAET